MPLGTTSTSISTSTSTSATSTSTSTAPIRLKPLPNNRKEIIVEVFEHERWSRKADGWIPSSPPRRAQWCTADGTPTAEPEELPPPTNYGWVSNWRVDTSSIPAVAAALAAGGGASSSSSSSLNSTELTNYHHDREGWEYATAPEKFGSPDRQARGEERWSDRARRRRWIRVARYKTLLSEVTAPQELAKQAQEGLKGLVRGRRTVSELCGLMGTQRDSADLRLKLFNLVDIVRQHGREIEHVLQSLRERGATGGGGAGGNSSNNNSNRGGGVGGGSSGNGTADATSAAWVGNVKKWMNDLAKEQRLFEEVAREVERRCRSHPLPRAAAAPSPVTSLSSSENGSNNDNSESHLAPIINVSGVSTGKASFRPYVSGGKAMLGNGGAAGEGEGEAELLRQLKFQDEEEVMEALTQERALAISEVTRHIVELRDVFKDFAQLVQEQQEGIDAVCKNVEDAHARTEEGYNSILKAHEVQKETPACCIS